MNTREQAVKTAGERLESIESWGRRIFIAAAVSAVSLAILAGSAVYFGAEYLRAKQAFGEASRKLSEDMATRFNRPASPSP